MMALDLLKGVPPARSEIGWALAAGRIAERRNRGCTVKSLLIFLVLLVWTATSAAAAKDVIYEGPWRTTNRMLDGVMTCRVTDLGAEKWRGRFYGVWQGVPFDYTVNFTGPRSQLRGTATIDGAEYSWVGTLDSAGRFMGKFGGSRYEGYFEMQEKKDNRPKPKR